MRMLCWQHYFQQKLGARSRGEKLPRCAAVLDNIEAQVAEEALGRISQLTADLPARGRFKSTLVSKLAPHAQPGLAVGPGLSLGSKHLSAVAVMEASGVESSYLRGVRRTAAKAPTKQHALYEEKMRGFAAPDRIAIHQMEKDMIVNWCKEVMVVRSGDHTETFRLQDRKLVVFMSFSCA